MKPFRTLTAIAAPLRAENVDTDQIIPARFLKYPREAGYDRFLFHDQRFDRSGVPKPDFVLNRSDFKSARILVAGANFGNGSSREGAAYALADYGIRCVIAPSFGQIFYKNCFSNGVLPVRLDEEDIDTLMEPPSHGTVAVLTVDLQRGKIVNQDNAEIKFDTEPFFRTMLMEGVDEIGLTLGLKDRIVAFENAYYEKYRFYRKVG